MQTLELTQAEIEIIKERRKTYDVEREAAEEAIALQLEKDIKHSRSSIARSVQNSRREYIVNRNLVQALNKVAGTELFTLLSEKRTSTSEVKRYYYTDEKGVRHATNYKSMYSKSDAKYGDEVIEWSRKYSYYTYTVAVKEFTFLSIEKWDGGKYYLSGAGYDTEKRRYKRLESLVDTVSSVIESNRNRFEKRAYTQQATEELKSLMKENYKDLDKYFYYNSVRLLLENGIVIIVEPVIDFENRTWKSQVKEIKYPEMPQPKGNVDLVVEKLKGWKPVEFD